jgi:superfamily II DNA or RNA helicase
VVVQAPTGSGKTYIFELLYPNLKTQAVFTVPTRAAPTRAHALHPRLQRSRIMHHKRLMMDQIHEPRSTPLRQTQPPLH